MIFAMLDVFNINHCFGIPALRPRPQVPSATTKNYDCYSVTFCCECAKYQILSANIIYLFRNCTVGAIKFFKYLDSVFADEGVKKGVNLSSETKKCATITCSAPFRGLKRIRTAVAAFAELCLATRPSDHICSISGLQIYGLFLNFQTFGQIFRVFRKI